MRRKIGVLTILCALTATPAFAKETTYGAGGCGLGSLLIGDEPGMIQILAFTLNGIAGNQTFGITSGTLNCEKQAQFAGNERLGEFVASNMDGLAKEMALGKGESIETLAELMAVPPDNRPAVFAKLQANFSQIFPSQQVEAADVIDRVALIIGEQ